MGVDHLVRLPYPALPERLCFDLPDPCNRQSKLAPHQLKCHAVAVEAIPSTRRLWIFEVGKHLIEPHMAIMEIKFNHRVPLWLTKLVSRYELNIVRYSKYCAAVDRELFAGRYS